MKVWPKKSKPVKIISSEFDQIIEELDSSHCLEDHTQNKNIKTNLTKKQKEYIDILDKEAKSILKRGGEKDLLMSLAYKMNEIKDIMDAETQVELNQYCERYDGFYQYMHLLERIAEGTSAGIFNDIIK